VLDRVVEIQLARFGSRRELFLHDVVGNLSCQMLEIVIVGNSANFAIRFGVPLKDLDDGLASHGSKLLLILRFLLFFGYSTAAAAAAVAPAAAAAAAAADSLWRGRTTLLFFHGALCWQTYDRVRDMKQLESKCRKRHGFIDNYAFGVRYDVYRLHRNEPGFNIRATEMIPPPPHANLDDETLRSKFCLCPSGTGWGMRVYHAAALGCIPVIIQRDVKSLYPPVLQAFEGLLLDWSEFSVRLEPADVSRLPAILRALVADEGAMRAKRQALAGMWTRLLWRESLSQGTAHKLRGAPDAFDSLMATFWLRRQAGNLTGPLRVEMFNSVTRGV